MTKHQSIYKLYPNVVTIRGDEAFDADGNPVAYDEAAVQAKMDATAYIEQRATEYPPITDYLDGVVKGDQAQIDKYIADCQAVKAKYPKHESQMSPADSVTFETIELDANKEYLLLKVACGQTGASVLINVDDAYGNNQQAEGVLDDTGVFGFLAAMGEMQDGPLDLTVVVFGEQGDIQAQATFELAREVYE